MSPTVDRVNQLDDLRELIAAGEDISMAVAYLTRSGLDLIRSSLQSAVHSGKPVKLLIDLERGITVPTRH